MLEKVLKVVIVKFERFIVNWVDLELYNLLWYFIY